MKSISSKIQAALIGSISILAVCAFILLSINQLNTFRSQQTIDTMTMEYSIVSLSTQLIQSYNSLVRNTDNKQLSAQYAGLHTKIRGTITTLQSRITSPESKLVLVGVAHTVEQVINECDTGIKEATTNNFQFITTHYAEANKDNEFVYNNVNTLLQKELEYLYQTQQDTQRIYVLSIVISLSLFTVIFILMVLFAHSFSNQLTRPLKDLSIIAKDIADGNLQAMDQKLLHPSNDEIGSLTQSIRVMVDKLIGTLNQQAGANDELTRMNALMVGRELRMTELKKQIEDLTGKLNTHLNSPPSDSHS